MKRLFTPWMIAFALLLSAGLSFSDAAPATGAAGQINELPVPFSVYEPLETDYLAQHGREPGLWDTLKLRVEAEPFNLFATIIFLLAVVHTLMASRFNALAVRFDKAHEARLKASGVTYKRARSRFLSARQFFTFLGKSRRFSASGWCRCWSGS